MAQTKILLFILRHAQVVRLEVIIDPGVGPGNVARAAGHLADVLLDLLSITILLPVLLQVHPVLGVDVRDVAHLMIVMINIISDDDHIDNT